MNTTVPNLQDPIRNYFYSLIYDDILCGLMIKPPLRMLDIGTRDSKWPVFLAQQGYLVTAVDRWEKFVEKQLLHCKTFDTAIDIHQADFLDLNLSPFNVVFDIFALQHNGNSGNDIIAWRKCAELVSPQGWFIAVVKFGQVPALQPYRDDGALKDYTYQEIQERIFAPFRTIWGNKGIAVSIERFFCFDFPTQTVVPATRANANTIMIAMERSCMSNGV